MSFKAFPFEAEMPQRGTRHAPNGNRARPKREQGKKDHFFIQFRLIYYSLFFRPLTPVVLFLYKHPSPISPY